MANYKEAQITGTTWKRAKSLNIQNPINGVPSISFMEEDAVNIGDRTIVGGETFGLSASFDAASTFALVDPATGEPTGAVMTQGELEAALHSLYLDLAVKRDNQPPPSMMAPLTPPPMTLPVVPPPPPLPLV